MPLGLNGGVTVEVIYNMKVPEPTSKESCYYGISESSCDSETSDKSKNFLSGNLNASI